MNKSKAREGENGSTRERLLTAAVEALLERGYRGATSREIAYAAGVNEVTLFRLFSTRDELLAAAVIRQTERERCLAPVPTGDLVADLEALAESMIRDGGVLMKLWAEINRLPMPHRAVVRRAVHEGQEPFEALFRHYQERGELRDDLGDDGWAIFAGPLLTAFLQSEFREQSPAFDPQRHVRLFLNGCGTHRDAGASSQRQ